MLVSGADVPSRVRLLQSQQGTGLVLSRLDFKLIYANAVALQVLTYPREVHATTRSAFIQQRLRSVFGVERFTSRLQQTRFLSGRRRYLCKPFLLESAERPAMVAFVLERRGGDSMQLADVGQRFRLSRRECETVQHLVQGLTTKEVAQRMRVSPNTVKQFVRLIMSKMGVTTRSGIVGKLIEK